MCINLICLCLIYWTIFTTLAIGISSFDANSAAQFFKVVNDQILMPSAISLNSNTVADKASCAQMCFTSTQCSAFQLSEQNLCQMSTLIYEELLFLDAITDSIGNTIYLSTVRSKFHILLNTYPILPELRLATYLLYSSEACAKRCFHNSQCGSFTHVNHTRECILLTSRHPVRNGVRSTTLALVYIKIEVKQVLDLFYSTLHFLFPMTIPQKLSLSIVSLDQCATLCHESSNFECLSFQYDIPRQLCQIYDVSFGDNNLVFTQMISPYLGNIQHFEKYRKYTRYFTAAFGYLKNLGTKNMIQVKASTDNACAFECLSLIGDKSCKGFIFHPDGTTLDKCTLLLEYAAFTPYSPVSSDYLVMVFTMKPFEECPPTEDVKTVFEPESWLASPGWPWSYALSRQLAYNTSNSTSRSICRWGISSLVNGNATFLKLASLNLNPNYQAVCTGTNSDLLKINEVSLDCKSHRSQTKWGASKFIESDESIGNARVSFDRSLKSNEGMMISSKSHGFNLAFQSKWSCMSGQNPVQLSGFSGSIASPGYPTNYTSEQNGCEWNIIAPNLGGSNTPRIILKIKSFQVGPNRLSDIMPCLTDWLKLTALGKSITLCGHVKENTEYQWDTSQVNIKFKGLYNSLYQGFALDYRIENLNQKQETCLLIMLLNKYDVELVKSHKPLQSSIMPEIECKSILHTTNSDGRMKVQFLDFGLGRKDAFLNCPYGEITVMDGSETTNTTNIIATFCGDSSQTDTDPNTGLPNPLFEFISTSNYVTVTMRLVNPGLLSKTEKIGFTVRLTHYNPSTTVSPPKNETEDDLCPQVKDDGSLKFPFVPLQSYSYNQVCRWRIYPSSYNLTLSSNESTPQPYNSAFLLRLTFRKFSLATVSLPTLYKNSELLVCDMDLVMIQRVRQFSVNYRQELGILCGSPTKIPGPFFVPFQSTDDEEGFEMKFLSDDRWNGNGFESEIDKILAFYPSTRSSKITQVSLDTLLVTPGYPDYMKLEETLQWELLSPNQTLPGVFLNHLTISLDPSSPDICQSGVIPYTIQEMIPSGRVENWNLCKLNNNGITENGLSLWRTPLQLRLEINSQPLNMINYSPASFALRVEVQFTSKLPIITTTRAPSTQSLTFTTKFAIASTTRGDEKAPYTTPIIPNSINSTVIIIGGCVVFLILLILVSFIIVVLRNRRKRSKRTTTMVEMEPDWEDNRIYRSVDDVLNKMGNGSIHDDKVTYAVDNSKVTIQY